MKGFSQEIKGLTKTDIMSITRRFIREGQMDTIFAKFGYVGWYGERKMYVIPIGSIQGVKAELTEMGVIKHWDADRERRVVEKVRRYEIRESKIGLAKEV